MPAIRTYIDIHGVERHRVSGRKVRSDRGIPRAHPEGCGHCVMVREYREQRDNDIARQGGFRNENARHAVTFKQWLTTYYREQKMQCAAAYDETPGMTGDLTFFVHVCGKYEDDGKLYRGTTYRVTFDMDDFAADDAAVAFLRERMSYCAVWEDEEFPIYVERFPRLVEFLNPECEHGLSLSLCAGPGHYPADDYYAA